MTQHHSNVAQGLGVAGLIIGVLAIPLGLIPCTFWIALFFGPAGIILSAIALSYANRANAYKGLAIAALVCSLIGTTFAGIWGLAIGKSVDFFQRFEKEFEQEMSTVFETFDESTNQAMEDFEQEMEKVFEDLDNINVNIDWDQPKQITEEEFEKFIMGYEKVLQAYVNALEKTKEGEEIGAKITATMAMRISGMMSKMAKISNDMTKEQAQKLEELHEKYKERFKNISDH